MKKHINISGRTEPGLYWQTRCGKYLDPEALDDEPGVKYGSYPGGSDCEECLIQEIDTLEVEVRLARRRLAQLKEGE